MIDLSLYLVTDRLLSYGRKLEWIVLEAVKGGVTAVQLREKECSTREFVELAIRLKQMLEPYQTPLIINDRLDIALAADADGLHIGQSDMPYEIARRVLGYNRIIGLSVENMEQARKSTMLDVDYIGISPVFGTQTKTNTAPPFGLQGVREVASFTNHPMVAIGGINLQNTADVIDAGAAGIAVVSAICSAESPQLAANQLLKQINSIRGKK